MLIAILMTNTDESEFASHHSKDGEKFQQLISAARPDWRFEVFSVKDDEFPQDTSRFDGVIITGSPASARDRAPWISRLEALICEMVEQQIPIYGACFGHQVIATALGGKVDFNPDGWVLGTVETELVSDRKPRKLNLYAAHKEQVTQLPKGAKIAAKTQGCPIAGFMIGNTVLTSQYHPEMTPDFIDALLEEMRNEISEDVINPAAASLSTIADRNEITEVITSFFERAASK
jgi:GMP synthase-like glutamine amidotransferase